jgi:Flp pilus assembly pilin Flp
MRALLNNFLRREDGIAALEFAMVLPVLMLITVGMLDVGRAMYQAHALEKGIRAGAAYAAHKTFPLSATVLGEVENIVKTGAPVSGGDFLTTAWLQPGGSVTIQTLEYSLDEVVIPVVRVNATVPFDPIIPGLAAFFDTSAFQFSLTHEQAYIGD